MELNYCRSLMQVRPQHYYYKDLKKFQALSRIRTHDLHDAGALLSQLSYQSHMRAVLRGLALNMWTLYLAQV